MGEDHDVFDVSVHRNEPILDRARLCNNNVHWKDSFVRASSPELAADDGVFAFSATCMSSVMHSVDGT